MSKRSWFDTLPREWRRGLLLADRKLVKQAHLAVAAIGNARCRKHRQKRNEKQPPG